MLYKKCWERARRRSRRRRRRRRPQIQVGLFTTGDSIHAAGGKRWLATLCRLSVQLPYSDGAFLHAQRKSHPMLTCSSSLSLRFPAAVWWPRVSAMILSLSAATSTASKPSSRRSTARALRTTAAAAAAAAPARSPPSASTTPPPFLLATSVVVAAVQGRGFGPSTTTPSTPCIAGCCPAAAAAVAASCLPSTFFKATAAEPEPQKPVCA